VSAADPPPAAIERTRLSWRRTTLSASAVLVLAATRVITAGAAPLAAAACAVMALVWLAILVLSHRRIRTLSAADTAEAPITPGRLSATPARVALLVSCLALLGAILLA
jgi:hypothetical protein